MPVIGEDQKRAAKMIKDKEKLQYKVWSCMLWLCSLGKVTWGDVNSSTEKSGWGSASALFEWRSYGPPSKVLCSKQKEAVPNLVDFFFLRWVQWHIPESEGYWLNKLIRCRKFPKMKNDWRLGKLREVIHTWSVLTLPTAVCLHCWRQIHWARWTLGLKKSGCSHGGLIQKVSPLVRTWFWCCESSCHFCIPKVRKAQCGLPSLWIL